MVLLGGWCGANWPTGGPKVVGQGWAVAAEAVSCNVWGREGERDKFFSWFRVEFLVIDLAEFFSYMAEFF